MSVSRRVPRDELGETLIELVMSLAILGVAGLAIVAGLQMSVKTSDQHRRHAESGTYVRSFAEAIQKSLDTNGGYADCGSAPGTYGAVPVPALPSGYTPTVESVKKWTSSGWDTCTGTDKAGGAEQLRLKVVSSGDAGHKVEETLVVVVRKPCNGTLAADVDPCEP